MTTTAAKIAVQAFICWLSSGLLQLHAVRRVRHVRWPFAEGSVHSERRRTSGHRSSTIRPYHAGAASAALAVCPSTSRVQGCMPGTLAGQTPAYIADDIQLVTDSDRCQLRSAATRTCLVPPTHNNFGDRSFKCCRPARVEQFTTAPATRHELCAFQASTENISIRELVNHGALRLFAVVRLRNTLTYLPAYLLTYLHFNCC